MIDVSGSSLAWADDGVGWNFCGTITDVKSLNYVKVPLNIVLVYNYPLNV